MTDNEKKKLDHYSDRLCESLIKIEQSIFANFVMNLFISPESLGISTADLFKEWQNSIRTNSNGPLWAIVMKANHDYARAIPE